MSARQARALDRQGTRPQSPSIERNIMTRLITPLLFAIAAALAAPAMAASHAGGAPMKANQPSPNASAPATHKKDKKAKKEKTAKKSDAAKKQEAAKQ